MTVLAEVLGVDDHYLRRCIRHNRTSSRVEQYNTDIRSHHFVSTANGNNGERIRAQGELAGAGGADDEASA